MEDTLKAQELILGVIMAMGCLGLRNFIASHQKSGVIKNHHAEEDGSLIQVVTIRFPFMY